ncbi:MAG: hypothetical protein VYA11_03220 [Planctomycetota bacterium]|nr:hypothetical protein [Planctomycetota bacterium]
MLEYIKAIAFDVRVILEVIYLFACLLFAYLLFAYLIVSSPLVGYDHGNTIAPTAKSNRVR